MTKPDGIRTPGDDDDEDAHATVATGIRNQCLCVDGWFASHADSGTPGPHIRLRTTDGRDAVLAVDQVPTLIEALTAVARRIERLWDRDGARYTEDVLRHSPDPNDPEVQRKGEIRRLELVDAVAANARDIVELVRRADSTDEALASVASLLEIDEVDVLITLARFDLLSLTQPAAARRTERLARLRDQGPSI